MAFTVVGVVADVKQSDWREPSDEGIYLPLTGPTADAWGMGSPAYVVKSSRATQLQPEVRELVRELAPEAPVYREYTMEFLARRSMVALSFTMLTLSVVSGWRHLGTIGLYGVLSYVVADGAASSRAHALGATARAVSAMVVGQGVRGCWPAW